MYRTNKSVLLGIFEGVPRISPVGLSQADFSSIWMCTILLPGGQKTSKGQRKFSNTYIIQTNIHTYICSHIYHLSYLSICIIYHVPNYLFNILMRMWGGKLLDNLGTETLKASSSDFSVNLEILEGIQPNHRGSIRNTRRV